MEIVFWSIFGLIAYTIVGYPLLVIVLSKLVPARKKLEQASRLDVHIVIPAYNEGGFIGQKLNSLLEATHLSQHTFKVTVISDGSNDDTVEEARSISDPRIEVIDQRERSGKISILNGVMSDIEADIVIFTDANSMVRPRALSALLSHFGDPNVGGVCGALQINFREGDVLGRAEQLYWNYDQTIKNAESQLGGCVSAQGTLYAIRRALFRPVNPDVADDFAISVGVVAAGKRLVYEPAAIAVEAVTEKVAQELGRRARSTERGWRALLGEANLMNPAKTGLYAWQLFSHKFLRRMMPFMLTAFLLINLLVLSQGAAFQLLFWVQLVFYLAGLFALIFPTIRRWSPFRTIFFFLLSQYAMVLGLVRFAMGTRTTSWETVR